MNFRELESKYAPDVPQSDVVTHITTPDTFSTIRDTNPPATALPTILAIRQSRTKSGPLGVNFACNGGPFIYTFNCPASHFTSSKAGQLTIEGIKAKAGTHELTLLELDVRGQDTTTSEIQRFLPLQLQISRRIIALLEQSDTGVFLKKTFLNAIDSMSQDTIAELKRAWDVARMYRTILTSTAYAIGPVTNFGLYGPKIAKYLFYSDPTQYRIAGHGYISGMIHESHLRDIDVASSYVKKVVSAFAEAENTENVREVFVSEVYAALAEFFDPSYYGLAHSSLEMFLDLDSKSFYWLLNFLKKANIVSLNQVKQIELFMHSLYHYLLIENIYLRHIDQDKPNTQFLKTYEPNGITENFAIISPGQQAQIAGKVFRLRDGYLRDVGIQNFRLAHDYPLPVTQTTLPGLKELELAENMIRMQSALVENDYILPNRRI